MFICRRLIDSVLSLGRLWGVVQGQASGCGVCVGHWAAQRLEGVLAPVVSGCRNVWCSLRYGTRVVVHGEAMEGTPVGVGQSIEATFLQCWQVQGSDSGCWDGRLRRVSVPIAGTVWPAFSQKGCNCVVIAFWWTYLTGFRQGASLQQS